VEDSRLSCCLEGRSGWHIPGWHAQRPKKGGTPRGFAMGVVWFKLTTRVRVAEPGTGAKTRLRKGMAHGSLSFRVEPSEPQGGVGRFDLGCDVCFRCVGLRSQSLAYPTLRYRALSGRRAVYQWDAAVRMSAPPLWEMRALFADCFRNSAAEPVAGGKTRLTKRESMFSSGCTTQPFHAVATNRFNVCRLSRRLF
jgi:hypothetical protein